MLQRFSEQRVREMIGRWVEFLDHGCRFRGMVYGCWMGDVLKVVVGPHLEEQRFFQVPYERVRFL